MPPELSFSAGCSQGMAVAAPHPGRFRETRMAVMSHDYSQWQLQEQEFASHSLFFTSGGRYCISVEQQKSTAALYKVGRYPGRYRARQGGTPWCRDIQRRGVGALVGAYHNISVPRTVVQNSGLK